MKLVIEDSSGYEVVVKPGETGTHVMFQFDGPTYFFHVSRETLYEILRVLEAL